MGAVVVAASTVGDVTALASGALRTSVMADGHRAHGNDGAAPGSEQVAADDAAAQKHDKLSGELALLSRAANVGGPDAAIATAQSRSVDMHGDQVQVVVQSDGSDRSGARDAVKGAGGTIQGEYEDLVQALVPVTALEKIANDPDVSYVSRPMHGVPDAVAGEGVAASGASVWQAAGLTGGGAKIGVIDFGFTNYQARIASGDLPANLVTKDQCGGFFNAAGGEHGTAVGEIVFEMAPSAQLYLICVDTQVDLGLAKDYAKANGINIIVHSASWFNTSRGDGTGAASSPNATVADAKANGILWVNSAGNRAQQHWSGTFRDDDGNNLHNFNDPGVPANQFDNGNTVFLSTNQLICVYLRWDAWQTTNIDYDLRLSTSSGGTLVAQSATRQTGTQAPVEGLCYTNTTGTSQNFAIAIFRFSAASTPLMELFVTPGPDLEWQTSAGSVTEPGSSPNAFAVAAVCWQNNRLEDYSSRGPTIDGRIKPDISGQSVVSSGTYGPWISCPASSNGTGNVSFNGTSAAAPHVGGAAALVKGANPSFTNTQIQSFLEGRAIDIRAAGKDNDSGVGVLALGAPGSAVTCTPRPRVSISSAVSGGRLSVTVAATGSGNTLSSIVFGNGARTPTNALLDLPDGRTGVTGTPTLTLAAGTTQTTFFVRRQTAGQATTVPFVVTDACGTWATFVGGGTAAGF